MNSPPLTPDRAEIETLLAKLRNVTRRRRRRQSLCLSGFWIAVCVVYFITLSNGFLPSGINLCILIMGSVFYTIWSMTAKRDREAALALTRFADVRAVGPLAEALEFGDRETFDAAVVALLRLLPALKASDAPPLNAYQRECLNHQLLGGIAELILAILKAFEQVGDETSLPYVMQLARGGGISWAVWNQRNAIREAAQRCLPFLQARIEYARKTEALLRPADIHATVSISLLRPLANDPQADPELMLRPMLMEEEPPVSRKCAT